MWNDQNVVICWRVVCFDCLILFLNLLCIAQLPRGHEGSCEIICVILLDHVQKRMYFYHNFGWKLLAFNGPEAGRL